jgi:hypothetical protein
LFFFWWNTLIYCNWRGRFVSGNCHNLCHWTVSSEDSCTRCTNWVVYVLFRSPSFGSQKTITTWLTKTEIFTLHSINIIRLGRGVWCLTPLSIICQLVISWRSVGSLIQASVSCIVENKINWW